MPLISRFQEEAREFSCALAETRSVVYGSGTPSPISHPYGWSVDWQEIALERPVSDFAAQVNAFDARLPVVETSPNARIDDFLYQVHDALVVAARTKNVRDRAREIDVDVIRAEEHCKHLRLRCRQATMRGGIFRMIGSRKQWRPRRIADGGRICIGVTQRDGELRAPEHIVILGVEASDQRIGAD